MIRLSPFIYLALLVIGIPWYWPDQTPAIIFGLPSWVIVAIGASFAASCLTAYLLRAPWPDESSEDQDE